MEGSTDAGRVRRGRQRRGARRDALPKDRKLGELTPAKLALVNDLPRAQREVLTLSFVGHSPAEIAAMTNRSPKAVTMLLYRARQRVLAALSRLDATANALVLSATRWLRRRRSGRTGPYFAPDALSQTVMATAVMPLITCLLVPVGARSSTTMPSSTVATRAMAVPAPRVGPPAEPGARSQALPNRPPSPSSGARIPSAAISTSPLVSQHLPSEATPETTTFLTAAPAPDYSTSHGIVALGMSAGCMCWTLFESMDGGASWTASPFAAPQGAEQVVLPPSWPHDPRIFIGTASVSGLAPYVVPRFGAAALPLPGPPGHVALSARFDQGDDRVLIAAQGQVAVLHVDDPQSVAAPIVTYPTSVAVASLATPPATSGDDVLILAPPGSAMTATPLAGSTPTRSVMHCRDSVCSYTAAPPSALQMAAQPSAPLTAVSWADGLALSRGGQQAYRSTSFPASDGIGSVAVQGARAWAVIDHDGRSAVVSIDTAADWTPTVHTGDPALARSAILVPLGTTHVLDLLVGGGLLCTADDGATWKARC